jgi:hypothetical protein
MSASVDSNKIKHLDTQLRDLHKQLRTIGDENNTTSAELFRIIHNPGYTSVLDVALATFQVDALQTQLKALTGMLQALQQGAKNALPETKGAGGD